VSKPAGDSDDDLPVPPPPPDEDSDEEEVAPPPPLKKDSAVSAKDRKAAVEASQKGPDHDKSGLFEAATRGDLATVTALVGGGKVYVDYQKRKQPVGWSALHFAVQSGQEAVVAYLLKNGADVNLRDGRLRTPLHKALGTEDAKVGIVKKLLEAKVCICAFVSDCGLKKSII
jgi:ankyrin repeat protein